MHTAEGRAHLSSNSKPLWSLLPEGALKLQLLAELAELVQLTTRELSSLWMPGAGPTPMGAQRKRGGNSGGSAGGAGGAAPSWPPSGGRSAWPPARPGLRAQPTSRADHAARLLLGQSHLWETLTNEYHAMLCELPMPHGGLFVWLEAQLHEHGPVNWTALRAEIAGQSFETLALRLMSGPTAPSEHSEEAAQELNNVLLRLSVDRIDAEMKDIAPLVAEAAMGQRYRALDARRKVLQAQIAALKM